MPTIKKPIHCKPCIVASMFDGLQLFPLYGFTAILAVADGGAWALDNLLKKAR